MRFSKLNSHTITHFLLKKKYAVINKTLITCRDKVLKIIKLTHNNTFYHVLKCVINESSFFFHNEKVEQFL